ncbi:MAG: hypothetical protein FVQ82_02650 [Planctomycetes bacterium]|nr:hypothetical protein [Planctomycetota bacterium]
MPFEIGNTYQSNQNYGHVDDHPWVIISEPSTNPEKIAVVNITSWKDQAIGLNDEACIVDSGEHPLITHKSFVYYRKALCLTFEQLEKAFSDTLIIKSEDCSSELLGKILVGAVNTRYLPIEIGQLLEEQSLI